MNSYDSRRLRPFSRAFLVFVLLASVREIPAQTRNWWNLPVDRFAQRGNLAELQNRKKVYLNVTFSDDHPNFPLDSTVRNDIIQTVNEAFSKRKDMRLVPYPEEAEFAVLVRASTTYGEHSPNFSLLLDPDTQVAIEVVVLIPGARQSDGTRLPRIVWDVSTPNAQTEVVVAARFAVNGFLWELRKLREKPF